MLKINKRKIRKIAKKFGKSLTENVLEIINSLGEGYTWMVLDYYHRGYPKRESYKPAVYSTLRRMKKQGLVDSEKKNNQVIYRLTLNGKSKLLIRRIFAEKKRSTDGLSSVVIFDIPEEKKKARVFLRRLLITNGFINLQKSVMIGPFDLPREFFELLEATGIRRHVSLLKSKVIYF